MQILTPLAPATYKLVIINAIYLQLCVFLCVYA